MLESPPLAKSQFRIKKGMAALQDDRHLFVSMVAAINGYSHRQIIIKFQGDRDEPLLKMYLTIMLGKRNRVKSRDGECHRSPVKLPVVG